MKQVLPAAVADALLDMAVRALGASQHPLTTQIAYRLGLTAIHAGRPQGGRA